MLLVKNEDYPTTYATNDFFCNYCSNYKLNFNHGAWTTWLFLWSPSNKLPIHEQNKTSFWSMIIKISYIISIAICCQDVNSSISSETNTKAWSGFQVFQILWITLQWIFLDVEENLTTIKTTYVISRWVPILTNYNLPTIFCKEICHQQHHFVWC